MKQNKTLVAVLILGIFLLSSFPLAISQEDEIDSGTDLEILDLDGEKLISLVNGILALILFTFVLLAYTRTGKSRLLFVAIAFGLFALRSFLVAYELIGPEIPYVDALTVTLDFVTMLSFFYGVLKK